MARVRLNFRSLTLFEDEEAGDTHMAMYANVRDNTGNRLATFKWNNMGNTVNEVAEYSLAIDPANPNVIDFELSSWATVEVSAFADDDASWPTPEQHENDLGSASAIIDPQASSTLGSLILGPTRTDNGNTGYLVKVDAMVIPEPSMAQVRIQLENLILYEDEELGSTHMAIYLYRDIDEEIFRWNNGGNEVNEVNSYELNNGGTPTTLRLTVDGPTVIWVEGYADDDRDWPTNASNENSLGQALITIDPNDPTTLGHRQLGPTTTDNGNTGFVINLTIEVLPGPRGGPDLSITGLEVTQAIQHFASPLGADNSVPLVADKLALVRAYLDSGLDPSVNGGQVANVTGILNTTGSANLSITPNSSMTAKPASQVNRSNIVDTLNFLIPADQANGSLTITVQATVNASTSAPISVSVSFSPVSRLDIGIIRIQSGSIPAPSRPAYVTAVNRLPLVYPIPTDPGKAIHYYLFSGSEVFTNTHNLMNDDGLHDLLGDLEDIQEDAPDFVKLYGLVSRSVPMSRFGTSRKWDNVAFGYPNIMESIAHELGHLYGLDHAPCGTPGNYPDNTDDDFVPPDGSIGDVGVDPIGADPTKPGQPAVGPVAFASSTSDFMSYCGTESASYENQWISAYHWKKLFNTFRG